MRTSLVAEKASGQRLRQGSAQLRGFRWWKHRAWGAVAQAEHHPMAKSTSTRIAEPVNPIKPQPCVNLKKARRIAKAQKRRTRSNAVVATVPNLQAANRPNSKHASTYSVAGKVQRSRISNRPPAGRSTVCAAFWPGKRS